MVCALSLLSAFLWDNGVLQDLHASKRKCAFRVKPKSEILLMPPLPPKGRVLLVPTRDGAGR